MTPSICSSFRMGRAMKCSCLGTREVQLGVLTRCCSLVHSLIHTCEHVQACTACSAGTCLQGLCAVRVLVGQMRHGHVCCGEERADTHSATPLSMWRKNKSLYKDRWEGDMPLHVECVSNHMHTSSVFTSQDVVRYRPESLSCSCNKSVQAAMCGKIGHD